MNQPRIARYGALDCYVIDPSTDGTVPSALVVLCHGYGAPGSDLVGVVFEWIELLGESASKLRFVCPVAPHSLAELGMPSGRAWWPINMARLMDMVEARRFEDLHRETPPGLDEARVSLSQLIDLSRQELAGQNECDAEEIPFAIGGFSQGAMLTMDTALRGASGAPALLMQFSGTVICESDWVAGMSRLENTRVYQSHGTIDPLLPFSSAQRLRDLVTAAGISIDFHEFVGPHTIDREAIAATAVALQELLA